MAIGHHEKALLEALNKAFAGARRLCEAQADATGGVVIVLLGHVRGFWRHGPGGFAFTPGGYVRATVTCAGVAEAVAHTLQHSCR